MGSTSEKAPISEPLAIIGLSCKFAGDATNEAKFWQLLAEGKSAWSEIPSSRFIAKGAYHPDSQRLSTLHVRGGHFFTDDLANFDAAFFNYSAETASTLDPQFRLQLESVYEALENAGLPLSEVAGSNTSVFAGTFLHDYRESLIRDEDNIPKFFFTGTGSAMASNRISHFFDFRGASMSLDTGCSSSLVALHQAVQSLRTGESDMSIVGGSNVLLNPDAFKSMGSLGLLSPDGKCFAFDWRANGYGRGEGVATVVIKRLKDAIASGDAIRAVIREIQTNQDGKTETITTPSREAQQALMRACYARAGLSPEDTTYFEAHGTGTAAGDPIEASAVASVFRDSTRTPLRIGSVKTNIGHTEATSGLAGVIKVVLAMEKGKIPPSINFEKPNPKLALEDWNLKVVTQLEDWPTSQHNPRRASVNSFGYGGSNAHVILEHGDTWRDQFRINKDHDRQEVTNFNSKLLILSAKDEESCQNMVTNLKNFLQRLEQQQSDDAETYMESLIYTLGQRRTVFSWLSAYPVSMSHGTKSVVSALDSPKFRPSRVSSSQPPRIGLVFTGQGAQWYAMGRELIAYPIFKKSLLEADAYLRDLGSGWSLTEELSRDAETTNVNKVGYSIPMCAAVQISLVRLLASWKIVPTAVVSHSSGEIAAAYTVGAISYRYAMGIAIHRSVLAAESIVGGTIEGGMIAVGLGVTESEAYLGRLCSKSKAVVACVNSPSSTTISGDLEAIDELEQVLKTEGVFARRLRVEVAYHSHHMKCIADEYREKLIAIAANEKGMRNDLDSIVFASPTTGYCVTSARQIASPNHWVASLLQPVQFVDAMTEMVLGDGLENSAGGVDILIEIGPHTALGGPIQQIFELHEFNGLRLPYYGCLVRNTNALETTQALAAALLCKGYPVDIGAVNFPQGRASDVQVLTDLPSYPWNHHIKHWIEPRTNKGLRQRAEPPNELLGSLVPGINPEFPIWRQVLRPSEMPWVRDHVLQGNMIYPGSGFIALAIEALKQQVGQKLGQYSDREHLDFHLRDFNVERALLIPDSANGIEVQTMIRPASDKPIGITGWRQFDVFSVTIDNQWALHATGKISASHRVPSISSSMCLSEKLKPSKYLDSDAIYSRRIDPNGMWDVLEELGIEYGPKFRKISSIIQSRKEMLSRTTISMTEDPETRELSGGCLIHPATLDAIVQTTYTALPEVDFQQDSPRVLQSIQEMWISHNVKSSSSGELEGFTLLERADEQSIEADIRIGKSGWDGGDPVLEIKGLVFRSLGQTTEAAESRSWKKNLGSRITWSYLQDTITSSDDRVGNPTRHGLKHASDLLSRLVHESPDARILEIGTGTFTQSMLESIRFPKTSSQHAFIYHFASATIHALGSSPIQFSQLGGTQMEQELNIHQQPLSPTLELANYDLVIASQALGENDSALTLQNIHSLMKPDGKFMFLNMVDPAAQADISDEKQPVFTSTGFWNTAIKDAGFYEIDTIFPAEGGECILSTASPLHIPKLPDADKIALVVNNANQIPADWMNSLRRSLCSRGTVEDALPTIYSLDEEKNTYSGKTCIFLGELDGPVLRDMDVSTFAAVKKMTTTCDRLLWITRGASVESEIPDLALASGFIRSLRHEYLDRCYGTLDLDPTGQLWSSDDISAIVHVIRKLFPSTELPDEPVARDFEYAVRNGSILTPRLFREARRDDLMSASKEQGMTAMEPLHQPGYPFSTESTRPGSQEIVPSIICRDLHVRLSQDASYLLVGGLGGLGYAIAHWMIEKGARNLILLSRSAGSAKSAALVDALNDTGCRAVPISCNVADEADLNEALQSARAGGLPPVRGVIQAAMVLQDTVLEKMSRDQFETVALPKVHGTWNLHNSFSTPGSLDFFVILSSVVAVIGNTSQVNYAAAGSFQDALARYRCTRGLPAVSINLGAVKGIGVAAETAGVLSRLRRTGLVPLSEYQVLDVLGTAISEPSEPQIVVGLNLDPGQHWDVNGTTQLGRDKRFTALRPHATESHNTIAGSNPDSLASKLNAASSAGDATTCVELALIEKISETFMISASEIDVTKPPTEYGVDSLVAVELRNMLAHQARAEVSIFTIMQSSSLHELAAEVATKSAFMKAA